MSARLRLVSSGASCLKILQAGLLLTGCMGCARGSWNKVGQVVGGRGDAGSLDIGGNTIDGQHYDHVISVEIDDRGAPLRLGVNRSDNPYTVADKCVSPCTLTCLPGGRNRHRPRSEIKLFMCAASY